MHYNENQSPRRRIVIAIQYFVYVEICHNETHSPSQVVVLCACVRARACFSLLPVLVSGLPFARRYDNFRFVEHRRLKYGDAEALALSALAEVPDQYRAIQALGIMAGVQYHFLWA